MSCLWREAADVVIEPDVAGFAYDDFKRAGDLVRVGEVAMRKALPEVRKWLESPAESRPILGRNVEQHPELHPCRLTEPGSPPITRHMTMPLRFHSVFLRVLSGACIDLTGVKT